MTSNRKGDWITTYTGLKFWPLDPRPEEVRLVDIAHSLALKCRFAGHCREFYSVAQHSVLVSRLATDDEMALWFLMHDAAEAYTGDIVGPLKKHVHAHVLGHYVSMCEVERRIMVAVTRGLHIPEPLDGWSDGLRHSDKVLYMTEVRDLIHPSLYDELRTRAGSPTPLIGTIVPVVPADAEGMFLERFRELSRGGLSFVDPSLSDEAVLYRHEVREDDGEAD